MILFSRKTRRYLPTSVVLYKPTVSYLVIPPTEHKRYLLLLIGMYTPSLAGSRETVLSVAHSTTSYYDDSYYVNDLENPDSDGSRGGGEDDLVFSTTTTTSND